MPSDTTRTANPDDAADRAATIIARSLAQGLMEAEVIIAADREARAQALPPQLVETLERFGSVLTKLVEYTEQLGGRVNELTDAVAALSEQAAQRAGAKPQLPEMEHTFAAGGEGIDVTISAVPGFQGLMDLQRALVRMPQVQSAAVRRYQDDEASIQLVLVEPLTASAIVEGLSESTGQRLVTDEARPDALRLRMRFL